MPFDSLPEANPALQLSEGQRRLQRLAGDLRNQEAMARHRFLWCFGAVLEPVAGDDCGTMGCALGLEMVLRPEARAAFATGRDKRRAVVNARLLAQYFDITPHAVGRIFYATHNTYGGRYITPGMVADQIDRLLAAEG